MIDDRERKILDEARADAELAVEFFRRGGRVRGGAFTIEYRVDEQTGRLRAYRFSGRDETTRKGATQGSP